MLEFHAVHGSAQKNYYCLVVHIAKLPGKNITFQNFQSMCRTLSILFFQHVFCFPEAGSDDSMELTKHAGQGFGGRAGSDGALLASVLHGLLFGTHVGA